MGKVRVYERGEKVEVDIKAKFESFTDIKSYINVEEREVNFKPDNEPVALDYTQWEPSLFPSMKVFKHFKLKKINKNNREIVYFLITNKTIKKYWEKINQMFKQLKLNKA